MEKRIAGIGGVNSMANSKEGEGRKGLCKEIRTRKGKISNDAKDRKMWNGWRERKKRRRNLTETDRKGGINTGSRSSSCSSFALLAAGYLFPSHYQTRAIERCRDNGKEEKRRELIILLVLVVTLKIFFIF